MKTPRSIIIIYFLLFAGIVRGQVISGKILNQEDDKPVPYASVFLDNTTTGIQTSQDGTFKLTIIKPGKYDLVVSFIGFETYKQAVEVDNSNVTLPVISLKPKANSLKEVTIRANPAAHQYFDLYYPLFKQQFLGSDMYAADCKILNPEILDIDYNDSTKTVGVSSGDFLQIENDALGYQVKYLLTDCSFELNIDKVTNVRYQGQVYFTAMKGSNAEENRWRRNREGVYRGSAMHFMRSLAAGQLQQEGFRILQLANYRNPEKPADSIINARIKKYGELKNKGEKQYKDSLAYWTKKAKLPSNEQKLMNSPLTQEEIIHPTDRKNLFALSCDGDELFVTYNKQHRFPSVNRPNAVNDPYDHDNTLIKFTDAYTLFDRNGAIFNPYSLSYIGAWGRSRIAELLPTDYEPAHTDVMAADTLLNRLEDKVNEYAQHDIHEKVYLHLDKPNYAFGDTIWYKAYTVLGQHHQLSALSGVLYVELISPKDSLVTRQMMPLVSGVTWSDIPLDAKLKPGAYRIRAYTRWMENLGDFYDQKIRIGGSPVVHTIAAEKPDVQFFPEGGELVNNVRSRVAIKAIGANGLGADIKGSIEDNTGTVVADFATTHLGMGEFAFAPEPGKSYKARINADGEASFTVDLPAAQELGYTLTVNNSTKDSIFLKVATNEQTLNKDKGKSFYIVAQSNGKVYYTTQGQLEGTAYTAKTAKDRFPMGITRFTLFNQNGEPAAERIAFISNKEGGELKLDLNTETKDQKVKINISAGDRDNQPRQGSFSMAVIDDSKVQPNENEEGTILNNLLLTSELKGYIEQPNYYFSRISDKTEADLDNLMLTQGYRKYEWKQILNNTPIAATPIKPESSQELNGILTTPGGKPIPNGKVTLMGTKDNLIRDTTANENGRFTFDNLAITDTATLVVKARKVNNGSNVIIKAIAPEYPKIDPVPNTDAIAIADTAKIKQQYEQYQKDQKDQLYRFGKRLKEVEIVGLKKKPEPNLRLSSNLNGPGNADQTIMYDQLGPCVNLADCMNGKTFGVSFKQDGRAYNNIGNKLMAIIVDGMVLDVHASLNDLNPNDVYSIEILRGGASHAIYGSTAAGGAIVITMKRGGEGTAYLTQVSPNGITTIKYTGFYKSKAFYIPKYAPKEDDELRKRTTIYWNPNILTDKDGKASLEYFNTKGTYRVVIEGIDDDGNLGRAVYRYEVK